MVDEPDAPAPFSLRRWSQRKHDAAREASAAAVPSPAVVAPAPTPAAASGSPALPVESAPLPPVESLTIESDFGPFMQPKVAEDVKRAALKKLFSDPQFNVMDGLDIYVGDYTQPDPMPAGMLDKLGKVYGLLAKDDAPAATEAASHASAREGEAAAAAAPTAVDARDAGALAADPAHAARTAPPTDVVEVAADESPKAPAAPALPITEVGLPSANAAPTSQVVRPATGRPSA